MVKLPAGKDEVSWKIKTYGNLISDGGLGVLETLAIQKQMDPGLEERSYGIVRIFPQMQNIIASSWFSINIVSFI